MSPKPEKNFVFDLLKLEDFVFFRNAHFLKNVVFLKPEHPFEGSSYPLCFLKNHEFSCFFKMLFFEGSGAHFFRFWSILEPPKSTLTPPKWCSRLDESTILKKTWFFMKKRCSAGRSWRGDPGAGSRVLVAGLGAWLSWTGNRNLWSSSCRWAVWRGSWLGFAWLKAQWGGREGFVGFRRRRQGSFGNRIL